MTTPVIPSAINGFTTSTPVDPTFSHWLPYQNAAPVSVQTASNYHIWHNGQLTGEPVVRPQGLRVTHQKKKRVRTAFTTDQLIALENEFVKCRFLATARRFELANMLQLNERTIKIWYQNRRMKEKKDLAENLASIEKSSENIQELIMQYPGLVTVYPDASVPTTPNLISHRFQLSPNMYGDTTGDTYPNVTPRYFSEESFQNTEPVPHPLDVRLPSTEQPDPDVFNGPENFSLPQYQLGDELLL